MLKRNKLLVGGLICLARLGVAKPSGAVACRFSRGALSFSRLCDGPATLSHFSSAKGSAATSIGAGGSARRYSRQPTIAVNNVIDEGAERKACRLVGREAPLGLPKEAAGGRLRN